MADAAEAAKTRERRDLRNRWLLSTPALLIILVAATGPLPNASSSALPASLKRSHAGMRCALASPSVLSVTMEDGAASAIEGAAARLSGPGE